MNTNWTAWCRPNRGRHWELVGESADKRAAMSLMLDDPRSGKFYCCPPGKPYPTPNRHSTQNPDPHARPEPAEATRS